MGLVARGYGNFYFDYGVRRYVYLSDRPSYSFGVALESAAEGGAPREAN